MDRLRDAYAGRRALVTGHTGFKGGWLSLWLAHLGAQVLGYSLDPPSEPSFFHATGLGSTMRDLRGDIRDLPTLADAVVRHAPEAVFHLAAQPLVRRSYAEPAATFATNVMGVVNLLEACRQQDSVRAIVVVTSDKCYENREWPWGYRENDRLGGRDPYSASKACAELAASAYARSFFPAAAGGGRQTLVATARAGNVIGGGDWGEDRLIPDCLRALAQGQPAALRNPRSVRPWQHVLEPLEGYLALGARLLDGDIQAAGPWNFGPDPGPAACVEDVVGMFLELWGQGARVHAPQPGPHEAAALRLDNAKARGLLQWRPRYDLRRALGMTVEWHRLHARGAAPETLRRFTLGQIAAHQEGL